MNGMEEAGERAHAPAALEVAGRDVEDRSGPVRAGVEHDTGERPEPALGLVERGIDGGGVGEVAGQRVEPVG